MMKKIDKVIEQMKTLKDEIKRELKEEIVKEMMGDMLNNNGMINKQLSSNSMNIGETSEVVEGKK